MAVGCGGSKQIHRYQPKAIEKKIKASPSSRSTDLVLAVADFSAGAGYDEQRIVYRSDEYRFDYYHFHRWASPPGQLVAEVLRDVYRETGAFRAVVSGYAARADVVLSGRVIKFEEVDVKGDHWEGNVLIDMRLRDAETGQLIWTETVQKKSKLREQSPSGLAAALSEALTEVGLETVDTLAEKAATAIESRRAKNKDD